MISRGRSVCCVVAMGLCAAVAIGPSGCSRSALQAVPGAKPRVTPLPNIVYILCDDLGYGDVQALNPERGRIPTPNLDKLTSQGMFFTNAHAGSSVCTPTRYGILTGRHCWRTRLQTSVLSAYDPPLIAADRLTVPALLKQYGYHTAGTGKWHLGWGVPMDGDHVATDRPISDGPTTRGFDEYHCGDLRYYPPYLYAENDRFAGTPLRNLTRKNGKPGEPLTDDDFIDVLPTDVDWAVDFIGRRAADRRPFFAYVAPLAPHMPLAVAKAYQGKSGLNRYADYVMEVDAEIGRILDTLDRCGLADNTLVIVTSDNGCTPFIGVKDLEAKGHYPSERSRGYKADLWDGGHRIPFIARWPGKVKPGSTCNQLICLTDLLATCANLVGTRLPDDAGEDSISMLPLLQGQQRATRTSAIHHSITGKFSLREGKWKLLLCPGSGGWTEPDDPQSEKLGLPEVQLYDMEADVGEQRNVQAEHPEVVTRMTARLMKQVSDGRSTPGSPQKNDVPVDVLRKSTTPSLTLERADNWLIIRGAQLPGGEIRINYLDACCRANSTEADWGETVIAFQTELLSLSAEHKVMKLKSTLEDGVTLEHTITAGDGEVDFRLTAHNPGAKRSVADWAQACPRLGPFTGFSSGPDIDDYLGKCFVFLDGKLTRMPTPQWATKARYTPGQVWCPKHVSRADINPRPLNPLVPSNGLIGCFSGDEKWIFATAWEPYQELFQGVIRCLHADFRIGGLQPGENLQIRGKIYIVPADVDALLKRYEADFPQHVKK